jgi:hypothetical protein
MIDMETNVNTTTEPQHDAKLPVVRSLGEATTVGELRQLLEGYSDDISFGFRNQPMQALYEVRHPDVVFVCFQ